MVTDILTRVWRFTKSYCVACGSKPMLQACLKLCKDFDATSGVIGREYGMWNRCVHRVC